MQKRTTIVAVPQGPVLVTEDQELDHKARLIAPPSFLSVLKSDFIVSFVFLSLDLIKKIQQNETWGNDGKFIKHSTNTRQCYHRFCWEK